MVECFVLIIIAYLVGSVSGSLTLGRFRGVDIRETGSGNAGGTNALRSQGWLFALGVVIIDIGKGAVAAGLVPMIDLPLLDGRDVIGLEVTRASCGVAAIIGHMVPIYHGFRGGKGVATFLGAVAVILPTAILPALAAWVLVVISTGYVGLASILAVTATAPLAVWLAPALRMPPVVGFCVVSAAIIVFAHRSNIRNMIDGNEHRFEKVRVVNWLKRQ